MVKPHTEPHPAMRDAPDYEHEFDGARYVLTVAYPEAARYPWLSDDELRELADDIAKIGLLDPIEVLPDGRILDGRNRELACKVAGVYPDYVTVDVPAHAIPAYVRRKNVLRRHLTRELRRELIADALRENPGQSNRAVAAEVRADDKTVAAVRADLEATAEIPQLNERTGRDGKSRATKPKAADAPGDGRPAHPFAELMAAVTKLSGDVTRALRQGGEAGAKLRAYLSAAGLVDNGTTTDTPPEFICLRGVRHLIDLAGESGKPKTDAQIKRVWENYGVPVHPEMRRIRANKAARKEGGNR